MYRAKERECYGLTGGGECRAKKEDLVDGGCDCLSKWYSNYLASYYAELEQNPARHADTVAEAEKLLGVLQREFGITRSLH